MDEMDNIISFAEVERRFSELNEKVDSINNKLKDVNENGYGKVINENVKDLDKHLENFRQSLKDANKNINEGNKINAVSAIIQKENFDYLDKKIDDTNDTLSSMMDSIRVMGGMVGGILKANEEMAKFCANMNKFIGKYENVDNNLDSANVNKLLGQNDKRTTINYRYDSENDEFVPVANEVPVVTSAFSSNSLSQPIPFLGFDGEKDEGNVQDNKSKALPIDKTKEEEISKYRYNALKSSTFAKELFDRLDPLGKNSSKLDKMLKNGKNLEEAVRAVNAKKLFGGIGIMAASIMTGYYFIKRAIQEGRIGVALKSAGLAVAGVLIGGFISAMGLGLSPLTFIAKGIYGLVKRISLTRNNVPLDGPGSVGKAGGVGRRIKGGIGSLIGGAAIGYITSNALGYVGESIGGESGKNVGQVVGGIGGTIAGGVAGEMIGRGTSARAIGKVFPKLIKGAAVPLGLGMAAFDAGSHVVDAVKAEDSGERTKSIVQSAISIAGPAIGLAVGGPLGMMIGSGISMLTNAIIDNTKASIDNTREQERLKEEALKKAERDERDVELEKYYESHPEELGKPNLNQEDMLNKCVDKFDGIVRISETRNQELVDKLSKENINLAKARTRYEMGLSEQREFEMNLTKEQLKSMNVMNKSLDKLCDNTSVKTRISFAH